ncbi:SurA N-terminal domain-containing protein [Halioxenophilus aromaticivorans]
MLQSFRDNIKGTVAIILVGLICIPFALFGIDSLFNTQADAEPAAEVNGVEITEAELLRAIQMRKNQLMQQFGENFPPQFLSDDRLREPVLQSLIQRAAMLNTAQSKGMTVAGSSIDQIILGTPDFQIDGEFDANRYQALIRNAGFTNTSYKEMITSEIVLNQFASGISQSNFLTEDEANYLADLSLQTRDFNYIVVDKSPFEEQVEVEESELQSYYEANQNQFMTPEQVKIEALELSADTLAASVEVDDQRIEEEYEQEAKSFMPATQRRAAHILLDPSSDDYSDTLADIQQRLEAGEEFAVLAKEYSQDFGSKDSGGDVGVTTGDSFVAEFEQALANLSVGEVSEPVESEFGAHIIKLVDVSESAMPSLEEMRMEIAQKIRQAEANEFFLEKLNDFKDLTYNVESLLDAAEQLDLPLWESETFSRFNGVGVAANPQVIEAAFSEELISSGFTSDPIELDESTVVVIRVVSHEPEAVKPFDDVKESITQTVKANKGGELLAESVESAIDRVRQGDGTLASVAEEMSTEVMSVEAAKRQQQDVDAAIVRILFSMPKPDEGASVYSPAVLASGQMALIELTGVNSGDTESVTSEERSAIKAQLGRMYGDADLANLSDYLVDQAEVEI